ncbi:MULTISPECIES: hypothetical protein [unclassified Cupriavidus]|uniref:hypothetical protein n=1 Tax=unclassified Cupriavidus TaxID=2640874 RepID=UPI00313E3B47
MKAAIQKAYALDTPREVDGGNGQDAWNVEGAARFANRLLWSALVDFVAVHEADAVGRAVSAEKRELANDARTWIAGAEDCRVTFDMCVELLFSSEIEDLAARLRDAIEVDPKRVLAVVEEAMREAEYESTVYRFMQRGSDDELPAFAVTQADDQVVSVPSLSPAWTPPDRERGEVSAHTLTDAMAVDVPPLPVQSSVSVRGLTGGQYLLPLFEDQEEVDQYVSAYDGRSARSERVRGM